MSETQAIRVLIADDQELVRAGFAMVIDSQNDMQVVGQAENGDKAVQLSEELKPDVMLMDVRMPGMDGIEATRRITAMQGDDANTNANHGAVVDGVGAPDADKPGHAHDTKVIILTTFDLDEYVMSAINAGASGFLLKDTEPETLLASIRTVFQGNAIIAPSATKRLIQKMSEQGRAGVAGGSTTVSDSVPSHGDSSQNDTVAIGVNDNADSTPQGTNSRPEPYIDPELNDLTERERQVLIEVAHGLSNQEICEKLFISMPTVKTHVAHVLAKIHARNRVQAVVFAYDNHLV